MTFSYWLGYILVHNTKFNHSHIKSASQIRPPYAVIHLLQVELSCDEGERQFCNEQSPKRPAYCTAQDSDGSVTGADAK